MNVTCDKCNKRYSIADDKVRGKSVKIRCKQCQNLISVQGPAPAAASAGVELGAELGAGGGWEEERTRAMPAMDVSAQWFAMVKGKQLGPFDLKGLEGRVKTGELSLRTYLWKQGMGDWKRASDVPEVSPVFAGISVGATATGPTAPAIADRPSSKRVVSVQRDVAVALQTPSPEITGRKTNGNGNGNGHAQPAEIAPAPAGPSTRGRVPSQARAPAVARPGAETQQVPELGSERARVPGQAKTEAVPQLPDPMPQPAPVRTRATGQVKALMPDPEPEAAPTAPIPAPQPRQLATQEARQIAPLSDLFGGEGENAPSEQGPIGDMSGDSDASEQPEVDPFDALGPADPSQDPPPGEATKFFIAQAGVNKRNPPWKIALFVLGAPGLVVGILFLLSTLKIVPLEVTRTNEAGEEVKENFFSSGGVSGIQELFSGQAKKKKAEAEKARLAAEKRRREAVAEKREQPDKPDKPEKPKAVDPALALIYGSGADKEVKGPRVRAEDQGTQRTVDSSGLTPEVAQKVMADKIKAFEGCIETALRRTPNLSVGPIDVVLTIGASGAVTASKIDPAKHNNTDWGQCMRDVGKRIVFPKSDGETEVAMPLKVGVAL